MNRPHSPSCDRNRDPILAILNKVIEFDQAQLMEVGSGTGQHAVYFASHFPQLQWMVTDHVDNHSGIQAWMDEAKLPNVVGPTVYQAGHTPFPAIAFDYVFTANTLHLIRYSKPNWRIRCLFWGFSYKETNNWNDYVHRERVIGLCKSGFYKPWMNAINSDARFFQLSG